MSTLKTSNLTFWYEKKNPMLCEVNLSIDSSERLGISAPSGFGKSTLCMLLAGYLKPTSGAVTLDGQSYGASPGKANPIQLIWQHPEKAVDPYSRLNRSLQEAGEVSHDVLEGLGIKESWMTRYPHELSGGELQRCCIARALAAKPQFLICDETTTMLDAVTQAQIWGFLLSYCNEQDIGMIVTTHSPALMSRLATRIVDLTSL